MRNVVIVSAVRTAIGDFQGTLSPIPADVLGGLAISEAVLRAGIDASLVNEAIMGCVLPHGLGQNPARQALLKSHLPNSVECLTVNKVCGSSLKAVMLAAQAIAVGDADVIVAGGMESMNNAPYILRKARQGLRMGHAELTDSMIFDGLWDKPNDMHMGMTAEWVADNYNVSRQDMDVFAAASYAKAIAADQAGLFQEEIMAVPVPQRKGPAVPFNRDEGLKPTPLDVLARLRPAFKPDGGRVTAGNASKISDGASTVLVMAEEVALAHGLKPLARIRAQGAAAVQPIAVLVAPIWSIPKVARKAGLNLADIELHEINEAFASSSVAIMRTLEIPEDRINVNGGAIAIGHPIGASGCRVLVTLLGALKQQGKTLGMASLCLGGGEGVSMVVERL